MQIICPFFFLPWSSFRKRRKCVLMAAARPRRKKQHKRPAFAIIVLILEPMIHAPRQGLDWLFVASMVANCDGRRDQTWINAKSCAVSVDAHAGLIDVTASPPPFFF